MIVVERKQQIVDKADKEEGKLYGNYMFHRIHLRHLYKYENGNGAINKNCYFLQFDLSRKGITKR